jgi:hypothetical protein
MFLFHLSVLYLLQVFGVVPAPLHDSTNTPWWPAYCIFGFLLYLTYFIARIRAYMNNQLSLPLAPANVNNVDTISRRVVPAELNYAACFIGFGVAWNTFWILFFGEVDLRMNLINLFYLLVVLLNTWGYYNLKISCIQMRQCSFTALMTLFTLHCLFTGGTSSPFFIILISVACFYHANSWMLQFSFFLFFLINFSTFVLPKNTQTKLSATDLESIYRLNFSSVTLFLAVLYIFYPKSKTSRPQKVVKEYEKTIMINETALIIKRNRELGKGSFGVVYEGKYGNMENVAIKVVPSSRSQERHHDLSFYGHHFSHCCENVVKYLVYHTDITSKYVFFFRCFEN